MSSAPSPRALYLQLHLLVILLASTAFLGKIISLPATALVGWRTMLAAVGGAIWIIAVRRQSLRLPVRTAMRLLGIGAVIGVHWLAFFGAVKVANISICLAGMATASFFTAFTEPFFEKRRIRPLEVLLGLMVLVGIGLVAGVSQAHLLGIGIALIGAFLAAVFPVLNRALVTQGHDPLTMVVWEMIGASVVILISIPLFHPAAPGLSWFHSFQCLWTSRPIDWICLLILALACTVFAHGFHIHLLRHLSAYTINLAVNFEPVYGIFGAALFFDEYKSLHPGFYLGTCAIIAANLLHPFLMRRIRHVSL